MSKIHCFYHSADLDGHCSGAIVKYEFPEAIMHPINYGDEFPWNEIEEEDIVYMVDFCLQPFLQMVDLATHGVIVVWIDHHKSAMDEYNKWYQDKNTHALDYMLFEGIRDTSKAACELTWEYLFPERPVPLAIKLLSLYDSWTYQGHELEAMVLPFQTRMRMENMAPDNDDGMANWRTVLGWTERNEFFKHSLQEGKLLLQYDEEQKRKYVQTYGFETVLDIPEVKYLIQQDDCAPDALEYFDEQIWERYRLQRKDFTEKGIRIESLDGLHIEYRYEGYILSFDGDDPFYKLRRYRTYKAIAVNLGHTNSKIFDSVWRKACPRCGIALTDGTFECFRENDESLPCGTCSGNGYIEPYDLMITFCRRSDRKWNVSLYSTKKDIDCGAIAKSFGGGGHKGAAGFQCAELPFNY